MGFFSKLLGPKEPEIWPVHVDDSNFKAEVTRSTVPVLLDVWGPNCAPCKQLEPIIVRLATRFQGRIKVAECNASAAPRTMQKLNVMGTPTVLYFKDGHIVERVVGFRGEQYHAEFIEQELLGSAPADAGNSAA